jgi:hypothetical protein
VIQTQKGARREKNDKIDYRCLKLYRSIPQRRSNIIQRRNISNIEHGLIAISIQKILMKQ